MQAAGELAGDLLGIPPEAFDRWACRDFRRFVDLAWPIVEPARRLASGWYLDAVCSHLQAVADGKIRRLVINLPPGLGKSLLVAVIWPAWVWTRRPAWRCIFASHAHSLAVRDSLRCRRLVSSEWYQATFGLTLRADQNRADDYENTRSGRRIAVGVGGGLTGQRADLVAVDDPLNAVDASSKTVRDSTIAWWDQAMTTRLDDPDRGALVVIQQRLHEDDLSGHLLRQGGWEHLCLPAEFSARTRCVTGLPWADPREAEGELLFPAVHSAEHLAQARRDLGTAGYSCQYLQSPVDAEGGVLPPAWWRFHKPDGVAAAAWRRPVGCTDFPAVPVPSKFDRVIIAADLAFRDTSSADYVVLMVVGAVGANRYVLEMVRARLNFRATCERLRELTRRWHSVRRVIVEARANGDALLSALQGEISGLVGIEPQGAKEARVAAISAQVEAGQVHLPEGAPWLDDFVSECAAFPRGRHDDIPDALAYALADLYRGGAAAERLKRAFLGRWLA